MRLVIARNQQQKTGMLGGNKGVDFTLSYRLELTSAEAALVEQYKLHEYALTWTTHQGTRIPDDTIRSMVAGRSQTLADVTTLISNEEVIKRACDDLPALFEVVSTFGGEEIIDYPRDGS